MDASAKTAAPLGKSAIAELATSRERFNRSTNNLTEDLSRFIPAAGMMTTAQQVAHAARVIHWFIEGAFRPAGFDMNFEEQIKEVMAVESLAEAGDWFERAVVTGIDVLGAQRDTDLMALLPEGPVLGGMPRIAIVSALVDHTAHHRGALTAYARINHIVPPDPFGM